MNSFNISIRDKLIIVFINILFIVSITRGQFVVMGLYMMLAIVIMIFLKPDYKSLPGRVLTVFLYPLFVSIFIPFINKGNTVVEFDIRIFTITVTDNGLVTFGTVLIKSFISILLIASLLLSTDEKELFYGLRKIKVPSILVSIMFLMYRYIFLIKEESKMGQMAINSRIFGRSYNTVNKKLVYLMGNLFIKSFDRAENIYRSMESRGFTGEFYINERIAGNPVLSIVLMFIFVIVAASLKIIELTLLN